MASDIRALLIEAMVHLSDPSRYWGCGEAKDFGHRVSVALAGTERHAPSLLETARAAFLDAALAEMDPANQPHNEWDFDGAKRHGDVERAKRKAYAALRDIMNAKEAPRG